LKRLSPLGHYKCSPEIEKKLWSMLHIEMLQLKKTRMTMTNDNNDEDDDDDNYTNNKDDEDDDYK
jgi:hypothetical protein